MEASIGVAVGLAAGELAVHAVHAGETGLYWCGGAIALGPSIALRRAVRGRQ
jgi:hypothetical protein